MSFNESMKELKNWKEVTKNLYRYVISSNVAYEIHVLNHNSKDDLMKSKSNLYISGDWWNEERGNFFERELLLSNDTLENCIKKAVSDDVENNK